jgi:beta-phosphoglucomutase family hydrolase
MPPSRTAVAVGLPASVRGCLFDLDGVLTRTATVHAAAWKAMFDEFLAERTGDGDLAPFGPGDYEVYLDGKPRDDGIRSFLSSRGITLPEGDPDDAPGASTVCGLGNRKNDLFHVELDQHGVEVFPGSVRYVHAVRDLGLKTALVSSSANASHILAAAGIDDLFDARIDGEVARARSLRGKPHPDTYVAGAEALGLTAATSAVFEDALAGVEAGHAGAFACVVGVDRANHADALRAHGADIVVEDLGDLLEDE